MHSDIIALRLVNKKLCYNYGDEIRILPVPETFEMLTGATANATELAVFSDYVIDIEAESIEENLEFFLKNLYAPESPLATKVYKKESNFYITLDTKMLQNRFQKYIMELQAMSSHLNTSSVVDSATAISNLSWSFFVGKDDFVIADTTFTSGANEAEYFSVSRWIIHLLKFLENVKEASFGIPETLVFRVEGLLDYHV